MRVSIWVSFNKTMFYMCLLFAFVLKLFVLFSYFYISELETVLGLPSSCGFQWKKRLGNPVEHSDRNSWSWETDTVSVGYVGSLKLLEYHCASLHLASHLASHEQMVIHAGNTPHLKQSTLILLIRRPVNRWHANLWTVNMKTCGLTGVTHVLSSVFALSSDTMVHYEGLWLVTHDESDSLIVTRPMATSNIIT